MAYLVIARKYRPLNFEDVIGQDHVTRTLMNAIKLDKVHHAFIFTGPRGVGKTTVSRILAKALNCEEGVTAHPCGKCKNCVEIDKGFSLDVKEIDGASNRGIDEIRDLRDDIKFSPASCRKKIYIIDEVHMLTTQAFNALLKTLEEPPEHAIFIFATTEINEVPATILSRCQRYDFKRVQVEVLIRALKDICDREKVSIDKESLQMVANAGDGSVRDSESVLDQIIAYCGNNITASGAAEALGMPTLDLYFEFLDLVLKKNSGNLIRFIDKIVYDGVHLMSYIKGMIEFFRNLMVLKSTGDNSLVYLTEENIKRLNGYTEYFKEEDLLYFLDLISQGVGILKLSSFQRIDFEIILLKILHYDSVSKIDNLLERMSLIEGEGEVELDRFLKEMGNKLIVPGDLKPKIESISANVSETKPAPVVEPALEITDMPVVENSSGSVAEEQESVSQIVEEKNSLHENDDKTMNLTTAEMDQASYYSKEDEGAFAVDTDILAMEEAKTKSVVKESEVQTKTDSSDSVIIEKKEEIDSGNDACSKPEPESVEKLEVQSTVSETVVDHALKTGSSSVDIDIIKKNWLQLAKAITKAVPQIGKLWEYSVPVSVTDGDLIVKFDPSHKTYRNLCSIKSTELSSVFNTFFGTDKFNITIIEDSISAKERIINIEEKKKKSPDELKDELLKEAPLLEFLFDQPLNCKVLK